MKNNKHDHIYEGATLIGISLFLMLVLFGAFGAASKTIGNFLIGVFGYAVYAVTIVTGLIGVLKLMRYKAHATGLKLIGGICMVLSMLLIAQIATSEANIGSYGAYLGKCYGEANTAGGALFGIIAYPLMAINYYFAIVLGILLLIASAIATFFVEIRGKAIYRTIVKGKGKDSVLVNTADLDDAKRTELNADIKTAAADENGYVPLDELDKLISDDRTSVDTRSEFIAPAPMPVDDNYGSVRVISDKERAARVLYGDKFDKPECAAEEEIPEEPPAEKQYSAMDVLYGNVPIEEVSGAKKADVKLDGDYASYTNSERKRIIKERLEEEARKARREAERGETTAGEAHISPYAAAHGYNGDMLGSAGGSSHSYTDGGAMRVGEDLRRVNENSHLGVPAGEAYDSGPGSIPVGRADGFDNNDRNLRNDFGGANSQQVSGRERNSVGGPDDSGASGSRADTSYNDRYTGDKSDALSDEKRRLTEYKEMLLKKRKERSDKGGEHASPIKSVLGGEIGDKPRGTAERPFGESGATAEYNAGASKVLGENGFGASINKGNPDYSRHNIKDERAVNEPLEVVKPKLRPYKAPPIAILREYNSNLDEAENYEDKIEKLETTLSSFKIDAKVINVVRGPAFSRLELQMPVGVSVNKISGLSNDIAMCLEAKSVRCQIPIPGKNLFGVEIPNKHRGTIGFKRLISSPEFNNNKHALSFAVGMDCDGNTCVVDLNKMPHLLIAGATGSGKSVCINTLICSLLFKYSPYDVKIALVDPKQVELSSYNGLPHLLVSQAICDNDKVVNLLDWTIDEMERRYSLMGERRVKNIAQYNETIDYSVEEKLPYIVVVVDEVADIVISLKGDFEERIMRLAQKARAAGIILVLATQRPSVDVITGSIKANLPSRIAFAVTNFADSKTILDQAGAEKLLGLGDMLFSQSSSPDLLRLQGAFIDNAEVNAVCDYIRDNNDAWFDPRIEAAIIKKVSKGTNRIAGEGDQEEEVDVLFVKALWHVLETGTASASRLQRTLSLGFPKASRYIDMMENMGFIGPNQGGNKPREVLISREQFLEMYGEVELY